MVGDKYLASKMQTGGAGPFAKGKEIVKPGQTQTGAQMRRFFSSPRTSTLL